MRTDPFPTHFEAVWRLALAACADCRDGSPLLDHTERE